MTPVSLDIPPGDFRGYIFDCDGTLADNMPLHYQAWTEAMAVVGGVFPEELFYAWGGRPTTAIVASLNEQFGLAMDVEGTVRLKESIYLERIPLVRPIEEVVAVARAMRGRAPMAVASGGHRRFIEATLDALGIRSMFDAVVCAEDYVRGKPAPDPLLEAARRLRVSPEECIVFDDSPLGIEAAEAAGMAWVLVRNEPSTRAPEA